MHMYAKVQSVSDMRERERENENDLSLFIISELAWYHSKKRKKKEEVGSQGVK